MSILDDIYCQICDRYITKEDWNKHLYSSRHLHREVNGYWPAYFPQRKLTGEESMILEKAFWKMIYANRASEQMHEFLITYFMMVTNLKNYCLECEEFKKEYKEMLTEQFEHDLINKSFSSEIKENESDTFQIRVNAWHKIIRNGGPIPNKISDYSFIETIELAKAAIDSERKHEIFIQILKDRDIIQ